MYFDGPGKENTDKSLEVAKDAALERGIGYMVVASTRGGTGLAAAKLLEGTNVQLVVVTHSTGHTGAGKQIFDPETKKQIESMGGIVYTGTDTFTGYEISLYSRSRASSPQALISNVLRMFGQGMKVCVEIVAMASDAGLVPVEDVVSVAGTGQGADTVTVIGAASTNQLFEMKIKEILAKPKAW